MKAHWLKAKECYVMLSFAFNGLKPIKTLLNNMANFFLAADRGTVTDTHTHTQ